MARNGDFFAIDDGRRPQTWKFTGENAVLSIEGTVVQFAKVPKINMETKMPERWPEGDLKANMRITLRDDDGNDWRWFFSPKSVASKAIIAAMRNAGLRCQSLGDIGGYKIRCSTEDGVYNAKHPRPFYVEVLGEGSYEFEGCIEDMDVSYYENKAKQAAGPQYQQRPQQPQYQQPAQPQYNSGWQAQAAQAQQALQSNQWQQPQPVQQWQPEPQYNPNFSGENLYDGDIPF